MGKSTRSVTIEVVRGKIVCNPWQMEVKRGENVQFICASAFAVHFIGVTPFPQVSLKGIHSIETGTIPRNVPLGKYEYFIAVFDGEQVLTADPDIIIRPEC